MSPHETQKAFRGWDPESRKILISRDVIFNEAIQRNSKEQYSSSVFKIDNTNDAACRSEPPLPSPDDHRNEEDGEMHPDAGAQTAENPAAEENEEAPLEEEQPVRPPKVTPAEPPAPLGKRKRSGPAVRWSDESLTPQYAGMAMASNDYNKDSESYGESPSSHQPKQGMQAEEEDETTDAASNNTEVQFAATLFKGRSSARFRCRRSSVEVEDKSESEPV